MSGLVDTNVLVRYLTGDPQEMADEAARLLDNADATFDVPLLVLAETGYTLESFYEIPRQEVVDSLIELAMRPQIRFCGVERDIVIEALRLCRPSGRVSYADALTWAIARTGPSKRVYTFDQQFPDANIDRALLSHD